MPFLYFTKKTTDEAKVNIISGTVVVANEMLIVTNVKNGADFAVYAPTGSTWTQNGTAYTSTLNGKNYWSMAFIPLTATNVATVANEYKKYAYVFPIGTTANYNYNEATSVLRTDFTVQTEVKEGTETAMLQGLLPHQWAHLAANSPVPDKYSYATIRGQMKTLAGNTFSVENTYHGILPTLPYVDNNSAGFTPTVLNEKISAMQNEGLATWTDSYNDGQVINRLIQTARVAAEMGNTTALNKMLATIKERVEDWLKADNGELAFIFYYNTNWSTLIGYPGGYGQDTHLNDHHFHWGYYIHAAAFLEQYEPGWAAKWGGMVDMLVRDAATTNRNDTMFPYLRNFSPFAGHCWADGFAGFPQGNNQESTSESMQFNSSLIHWGEISGNKATRDLGIYLYTTEQTAIEEYWMDTHHRNFPPTQRYSLVSRVWGNSIDNGTFWTADIAASYGIEMYPIHGGSLYLGQDTVYVKRLWDEVAANTGILKNEANPNLWHDMWWEYLAFINPAKAIEMYNSYPNRSLKFGITDVQTYHWLHSMNALGRVDATITANYPIAAAFRLNGNITYVAQNYSNSPITVTFSTGYQLVVPARKLVTSKDVQVHGTLTSSFAEASANGSVKLTVNITEGTPAKVEYMDGTTSLGTLSSAPYVWNATNLSIGTHNFYAKVFDVVRFNTTNGVTVQVGNQLPYGGVAWAIPGTTEAGKYDTFEGGKGQDIAYMDVSAENAGNFRMNEYVDCLTDAAEGATVGWISMSEWMEYSVKVAQTGLYSFDFRYASGNVAGGGPFHLEIDDRRVSGDIITPTTSSWTMWTTKTVTGIPLTQGDHILRIACTAGEFNLGRMTFTRSGDLTTSYPTAMAGADIKVIIPNTSSVLDGSASTESGGKALTYAWTQVYGPTEILFSDKNVAKPTISGLSEGMYRIKLTVTNTDLLSDDDDLLLMVSKTDNIIPTVSILSPLNNATFAEGKEINITASASDFDGTVQQVDFYQNGILISTDNSAPYSALLTKQAGDYVITAKATDNQGATSTSPAVNVKFLTVHSCSETSTESSSGAFVKGYKCTFETVGTDVNITFELLDNVTGTVAYIWNKDPFTETAMKNVTGNKFTSTVSGKATGSTISMACKFVSSGGTAVTKYINYTVGNNCANDTEIPTAFTASVGALTYSSIDLLLKASDNSGVVAFNISYGGQTKIISGVSGVDKLYRIIGLTANTNYTFVVTANDVAGNMAANSPISLPVTTPVNTNTECSGTSFEAAQGSFITGYNYSFRTVGTDVIVTFELLDTRSDLKGYAWTYNPNFAEVAMTGSGKVFTKTFTGQTAGATFKVGCKFSYAGGMAVTKTFSYTIGKTCAGTGVVNTTISEPFFYPNPVQNILHLQLTDENNRLVITNMLGKRVFDNKVSSNYKLNMSTFDTGVYFIRVENASGIFNGKVIKN
jgi:endoglucanase Acf2